MVLSGVLKVGTMLALLFVKVFIIALGVTEK